uniref:Major facilitator superfamily (MFS) profile domain-containing protein n=1 Tax=Mola mola TaxID=94237 RepID=A0A3Q3W6M4_MOLML
MHHICLIEIFWHNLQYGLSIGVAPYFNTKMTLDLACFTETFTLNDALESIGFGKFHCKLALMVTLSWIASSIEVMITSLLAPQLRCEWRLPSYQVALITSMLFFGMGTSSPVWGHMVDRYGRRVGLWICTIWTAYFGLLSSFAPTYGWFLFLRCIVGFGLGGTSQAMTLYSEFLPMKARGCSIMIIGGFWSTGTLIVVLLAMWIMPTLGWMWLLGLSVTPMAIFISVCFWIPESLRFDMLTGNTGKAMATLRRMAKENGKPLPQGKMIAFKQVSLHIHILRHWRTTILLPFIWLANSFSYYGIVLLTTEFLQSEDSCGLTQEARIEQTCSLQYKSLTSNDYKDILWTTLAEFPGLLLCMLGVDRIGRKKSMAVSYIISFLSFLPLYGCIGRYVSVNVSIFIARAFIYPQFHLALVYTLEVTLALGICIGMGRLGSLISPFVSQVMLTMSLYLTLSIYCGCCLLSAIACVMLPIETMGMGLRESTFDGDAVPSNTTNNRSSGATFSCCQGQIKPE